MLSEVIYDTHTYTILCLNPCFSGTCSLKEPEGKAVTNFSLTLPEGYLAQETTKDPLING